MLKYCLKCNKAFTVTSKHPQQKYCSRSCSSFANTSAKLNIRKAVEAKRGKPAWNRNRCTLICQQCKHPFEVPQHRKNTANFCSRQCHYLFNKTITGINHPLFTRLLKHCEWCGKDVWVKPAKFQEFRFCSRQCLGAWVTATTHSPTIPEIITADALTKLHIPFEREYRIGRYSCDIAIPQHHIIIEVDGDYWHSKPKTKRSDKNKDYFLASQGWIVLRFREKDIHANLTKCLVKLNKYIHLFNNS